MKERQKALKKQRNRYKMGNEYDDDDIASSNNGTGHVPYNQVRDEESSRKLDHPQIVEDVS